MDEGDRKPLPETRPPFGESRWGRAVRIFLLGVLILYVFHPLVLTQVGRWLVYEDQPGKAGLIVVLSGSPVVRGLAAADWYKMGLAGRVYVSRGNIERSELVARLDLARTGDWDVTRRILEAQGVPAEAVIVDGAFVDSTLEEARRLKTFLAGRGPGSIILVTSRFHSRRAFLTFTHVLGPETRVISLPSPYDPFNPEDWWKSRATAKRGFLELLKLAWFYWETLVNDPDSARE
ncbi:MAG: YdcF family protein [Thermodesulfobacteriota bacterium]